MQEVTDGLREDRCGTVLFTVIQAPAEGRRQLPESGLAHQARSAAGWLSPETTS